MSSSDFSLSDSSTDSDSETTSDTIKELEDKIAQNEYQIEYLKKEKEILKNEVLHLEIVIVGFFVLHAVMWFSGNSPIY